MHRLKRLNIQDIYWKLFPYFNKIILAFYVLTIYLILEGALVFFNASKQESSTSMYPVDVCYTWFEEENSVAITVQAGNKKVVNNMFKLKPHLPVIHDCSENIWALDKTKIQRKPTND